MLLLDESEDLASKWYGCTTRDRVCLRLQRQHPHQRDRLEHHHLCLGLREPHDQRDSARDWWNGQLQVRSLRKENLQIILRRYERLRLRWHQFDRGDQRCRRRGRALLRG